MSDKRQIFVFGSNREGRHGAGAALAARKFHGAIYGQASGLQGESYAIVTKELRSLMPPVTLAEIGLAVEELLAFARMNPELEFTVTPIGCGLGGFKPEQIAPLFVRVPFNVRLPQSFLAVNTGMSRAG